VQVGDVEDRRGEHVGQLASVVREPGEQRTSEAPGVPLDTVAAEVIGPGDAGSVQQDDGVRHRADEVLVDVAGALGVTRARRPADLHGGTLPGDPATPQSPGR
jgi:hypothetical protein